MEKTSEWCETGSYKESIQEALRCIECQNNSILDLRIKKRRAYLNHDKAYMNRLQVEIAVELNLG